MRKSDIRVGGATIPVHDLGGWALPGGSRTNDEEEATAVAAALAKVIDRKPKRAEPARTKPVVTRRKVAASRTAGGRA